MKEEEESEPHDSKESLFQQSITPKEGAGGGHYRRSVLSNQKELLSKIVVTKRKKVEDVPQALKKLEIKVENKEDEKTILIKTENSEDKKTTARNIIKSEPKTEECEEQKIEEPSGTRTAVEQKQQTNALSSLCDYASDSSSEWLDIVCT